MAAKAEFLTTKTPGASSCVSTDHLVFASAVAIDPKTLSRVPEANTIANEMQHCLNAVEDALGLAGCSLRDIVKASCYVSDEAYRTEALEAYRARLGTGPYPTRTTLVMGLAGNCRVQVEVTAARP